MVNVINDDIDWYIDYVTLNKGMSNAEHCIQTTALFILLIVKKDGNRFNTRFHGLGNSYEICFFHVMDSSFDIKGTFFDKKE